MDVLNEREKTHGDFAKVAEIATTLKRLFRKSKGQMSVTQTEALDLIATKLARIACGDPDVRDHWEDIAGYAQLVVRDLRRREIADMADEVLKERAP